MKSVITNTTLEAIIAGFDALEVDDRFIASSFRYSLDATKLSSPIANLERLLSHHTNNADYLSPELFNFACASLALLTNASFESNPGLLMTCSHILKRQAINGALHDATSQLINTSLTGISANLSDLSADERKAASDILSNLHPAKLEGLLSSLQQALTIHRKTGKHLSPKLYDFACASFALLTNASFESNPGLLMTCSHILKRQAINGALHDATSQLINTSLTSISANLSDLSAVEYKAAGDILSNLHPAKLEGLLSSLQQALTIHRKTGKHLSPKLYALTCGSLALITGNRRTKKLELLALCSKALRTHLLSRELFSAVVSLRDKLGAMPSAFNRTRPFTPAIPAPTPSPESIPGDDIPTPANDFKPISLASVSVVPTPPYSASPKSIPKPCELNPLKRKAQEMCNTEAAETLLTIIQANAQKPA